MATPSLHRLDEKRRNRLIAYVKQYPILYQQLNATKDTKTRDQRKQLWDYIGNQLQTPGTLIRMRFILQYQIDNF